MKPRMKFSEVCAAGLDALKRGGVEDASFDCSCLFFDVFGVKRAQLILHDGEAPPEKTGEFIEKIDLRVHGTPLQYLLGKWDFYDMTFFVGEGVLIPRPETETLVELALEQLRGKKGLNVFDLCAGSGCIGLTLAKKCPDCTFYLVDVSPKALGYARRNKELHGLDNVRIIEYDIRGGSDGLGLSELPDMIVSNPPYVPAGEIPNLQKEVRFEPKLALDGGEDGMDFYPVLAEKWIAKMPQGGFAAVECGEGQAEKIADSFRIFGETSIVPDPFGVPRFVAVTKT